MTTPDTSSQPVEPATSLSASPDPDLPATHDPRPVRGGDLTACMSCGAAVPVIWWAFHRDWHARISRMITDLSDQLVAFTAYASGRLDALEGYTRGETLCYGLPVPHTLGVEWRECQQCAAYCRVDPPASADERPVEVARSTGSLAVQVKGDAAWRECSHRADYRSGAEHGRDCPEHGTDRWS